MVDQESRSKYLETFIISWPVAASTE